ncbi:flippase [Verrucomicrobiota bacterium]
MKFPLINLLPEPLRRDLHGDEGIQKIATNVAWLVFDYALRLGVSFLVLVWLARHLGPRDFGAYSYALALITLLAAVATLGLNTIAVRDIVKHPEQKHEILGTAFMLKILGGIVGILLAFTVATMAKPGESNAVLRSMVVIISFGFLFRSMDVVDIWFQSQVLSKYTVIARSAASLLANVLRVVLIVRNAPLVAFAWMALIEIGSEGLALLVAYRAAGGRVSRWRTVAATGRRLFADSWPLALAGLAVAAYMRIDQVMLGQLLGDRSVGIYSASVRLAALWYFIPNALVPSVFPAIIRARQVDPETYRVRMQALYGILALISICVALIVTMARGPIVSLLYGADYQEAAGVLGLHIWAGLFVSLGVASQRFLLAENLAKVASVRTFLGCATNILLNALLIPPMGIRGAAVATLASYAIATFSIGLHRDGRPQALMMLKSVCLAGLFSYARGRITGRRQ